MKMITAFIKPHKLMDVTDALHGVEGLSGGSVSDVRVEVACPDELVGRVVTVIETASHTGLRGDGKIYVAPLDQAVRISTGERGDDAV